MQFLIYGLMAGAGVLMGWWFRASMYRISQEEGECYCACDCEQWDPDDDACRPPSSRGGPGGWLVTRMPPNAVSYMRHPFHRNRCQCGMFGSPGDHIWSSTQLEVDGMVHSHILCQPSAEAL